MGSRGPETTKNHRKSILRVFCLLLVPLALTWPRWICAESLDFLPLVPLAPTITRIIDSIDAEGNFGLVGADYNKPMTALGGPWNDPVIIISPPEGIRVRGNLGFFEIFLLGGLRPPRTPHRRSAPGFKDCFRKNQRFFGIY